MSIQGAPVRSRQKMPFKTLRSSERGTPRTLLGSSGAITDHSKSVRSKRPISKPPNGKVGIQKAPLKFQLMSS